MATNTSTAYQSNTDFPLENWVKENVWAHSVVLVGRFFYSLVFILSSFGHFSSGTIGYAAKQGVPFPYFVVPMSGLLALFGGISILLGFHARIGAILIILFLIPVTLMMHNFWSVADVAQAQIQQIMFMKNLSMLGGAILLFSFGAGPMSFDQRKKHN